jgi:pimeloyl-ACP methyl ester carboxylesterase
VICGTLRVPENRARRDTRMLGLPFSILKAERPPAGEPMVVLVGGPGGSAHGYVGLGEMPPLERLRAHHDIIVLEQRGTGYTDSPLLCEGIDTYPIMRFQAAAFERCKEKLLRAGVDLQGYDTATNAQDFADLKALLKIKTWNLIGNSYGTRLGLTLLNYHPEGIRAVVLDATFPLYFNNFYTAGELQGISHVVAACVRDAQCRSRYPKLHEDFIALIERLDQNPITVKGQKLGGEFVIGTLALALGNPEKVSKIPAAIEQALAGKLDPLLSLGFLTKPVFPELPPPFDARLFLAWGMYALVECRDSYYHAPPLDAPETPTGGLAGWPPSVVSANSRLMDHNRTMCRAFDPGPSATPMTARVHSPVPVLVLNGQFDGGTTAEMGASVAIDLGNATHIITPGVGHSSLFQPCVNEIVERFIETPDAPVDRACLKTIPPLKFE